MRRIAAFLSKQGIKTWVDNEKLIPGTPIWEEEIEKAIKNASAVVVVLSPDSKSSEWVRREISLADQNRTRIFPVLVRGNEDSSVTLRLITRQFVDLRSDEDTGLEALHSGLAHYLNELSKGQTEIQETIREETNQHSNLLRKGKGYFAPKTILILGMGGVLISALVLGIVFYPKPSSEVTPEPSPHQPQPIQESTDDCPPGMVLIPEGSFILGTPENDTYYEVRPGETPSRIINLSNYCMDITETSNKEYGEFVETKSREWISPPESDDTLPVTMVSWFDGMDYCEWKGEQVGIKLKLPNEFQWEKAARGPDGKIYPWGNNWAPDLANAGQGQSKHNLVPVDSYSSARSYYGVLNMAGNVAEWVEDWYYVNRYAQLKDGDTDPKVDSDPNAAEYKVVRGGSTSDNEVDIRSARRLGIYDPYMRRTNLGFRCATEYLP
jgi:iron(II)-dependent oxidoreductase